MMFKITTEFGQYIIQALCVVAIIICTKTSGGSMFELVRTPGEGELRDTSSTTSNVLQEIFKPVCPCVFA